MRPTPQEMENILKNYKDNTTYTNVLCNDGSTQRQASSPNGKFADACRNNGGRAKNQGTANLPTPTKYTTIAEETIVWKSNPNATGDGDSKLAVRTLPKGTVVNVIAEGETRTSWSVTPILKIGNDEWIDKNMYSLIPSTDVLPPSTDVLPQSFIQKNKTNLLIAGALVLGYFAYKKFNK